MKNNLLSIIIVTWNTAEITLQCVNSINKHLKNQDYEIIIVDNNSTDNTQEVLNSKVRTYIKNSQNLGFSKANNIGARAAKGDILFFLNSDMKLIDNSIIEMKKYLEGNDKIGVIGPQLLNSDLSPQASVFPKQTITGAFLEFWLKHTHKFSKYVPLEKTPQVVNAISGGAVMIKKGVFQAVGGWNERYFFYFEDLDLCRTIQKRGLLIYYFPQSKVIHYHGQSGKNIASSNNQWKRLIPSSIIYHGYFKHLLLTTVLWLGQKIPKQ